MEDPDSGQNPEYRWPANARLLLFLLVFGIAAGTAALYGAANEDPKPVLGAGAAVALVIAILVPALGTRAASIVTLAFLAILMTVGLAVGRRAGTGVTFFFLPSVLVFALEHFGRRVVLGAALAGMLSLAAWFALFRTPSFPLDAAVSLLAYYTLFVIATLFVDEDLRFARMEAGALKAEISHRFNNNVQMLLGLLSLVDAGSGKPGAAPGLNRYLEAFKAGSAAASAGRRLDLADLEAGAAFINARICVDAHTADCAVTAGGTVGIDAAVPLHVLVMGLAQRLSGASEPWTLDVRAAEDGSEVALSATGAIDRLPSKLPSADSLDPVEFLLYGFGAELGASSGKWSARLRFSAPVSPLSRTGWALPRRGPLRGYGLLIAGRAGGSGGLDREKTSSFALFSLLVGVISTALWLASLSGLGGPRLLAPILAGVSFASIAVLRVAGHRRAALLLLSALGAVSALAGWVPTPGAEYGNYLHLAMILPLLGFGFLGRRVASVFLLVSAATIVQWRLLFPDAPGGGSGFSTMLVALATYAASLVSLSLDLGRWYLSKGSLATLANRRYQEDLEIVQAAHDGTPGTDSPSRTVRIRMAAALLASVYEAVLCQADQASVDLDRAAATAYRHLARTMKRRSPHPEESACVDAGGRRAGSSLDVWRAIEALFVIGCLDPTGDAWTGSRRRALRVLGSALSVEYDPGSVGAGQERVIERCGGTVRNRGRSRVMRLPLGHLATAARALAALGWSDSGRRADPPPA
ncbi:MAG TPA: hypothetical protein PKW82_01420 [Spirochaetales bacterium]|nr:hypothetical protein [Spirochaetales bacterium]